MWINARLVAEVSCEGRLQGHPPSKAWANGAHERKWCIHCTHAESLRGSFVGRLEHQIAETLLRAIPDSSMGDSWGEMVMVLIEAGACKWLKILSS